MFKRIQNASTSTQVSLVAAAVAAALGTSAAYALPPADWTNGTITNVYYAGGGSSDAQAVYVAVSNLLVTSSIDVYTDGTGSSKHPQSLSYLIISGTTNGNGNLTAGQNVGFLYRYSGGAFTNGIQPFLGSGSALSYPTLASIASVSGAPAGYSGSNPTSVNPDYQFSPTLGNAQKPAWGISDEEPAIFGYYWNANNVSPIPAINPPTQPLYVAAFGVAVTANVYAQKKQWSAAELAAVYQGPAGGSGITAWSQLTGDNGSPLTVPGPINIVDRNSGAAVKAAANLFFFNYPESTTHFSGQSPPYSVLTSGSSTTANNYTGTVLVTSGTVTNSFQDIKEPSSPAIVDDLNAAQAAGLGAIGVLGLEYPPVYEQATSGTNSYDFVAINGAWPDSETGTDDINNPAGGSTQYSNIVNGRYTFAYQTGFQNINALGGFNAAVYANLSSESLSAAHTGQGFPSSADGVLLDPATTGTTDAGNLSWTRSGNSNWAPLFYGVVSTPLQDPL